MTKVELHYIGGIEPIILDEVTAYTPMPGWFVVYFEDESLIFYPTDHIEQVNVVPPVVVET